VQSRRIAALVVAGLIYMRQSRLADCGISLPLRQGRNLVAKRARAGDCSGDPPSDRGRARGNSSATALNAEGAV
jgi:hypothetical protein